MKPQHSIEAEQSVIGGVLLEPTAYWRIADAIVEADFFRRDHQLIWRAICELTSTGHAPDAVTLGEWFQAQGLAEMIGDDRHRGASYVLMLANTTPSAANIGTYAKIVSDKATLRRLNAAGAMIAKISADPDGRTVAQIGDESRRLLSDTMPIDVRAITTARDAVKISFDRIQERFEAKSEMTGLSTGIPSLDQATGGLQPGRLYILAARPSIGKSLVAGHVALSSLGDKNRIAIFSLEMPADEWTDRWIASTARVDAELLTTPRKIDDEVWTRITTGITAIRDMPILIDASGTQTLLSIEARAMQMHAASPLSLIIVDHLGLIDIDESKNPARQIGLVTKGFKALAKRLQIPVLLLCQLNRDGDGKPPALRDLRESGRIEEDADGVIMLHRPGFYQPENGTIPKGYCEAHIRKLRGGKLRTLHWHMDLARMRVEDSSEYVPPPTPQDVKTAKQNSSKSWTKRP